MYDLPRLSRAAGERTRPRCRLHCDSGPLARADLASGDAQAQTRALPEAHGALHRRGAQDGADGARDESRGLASGEQPLVREYTAHLGMAPRWSHRARARSSQLVQPPILAAGNRASGGNGASARRPRLGLWLGPAAARPYSKAYLPFVWRGWYDFGCGSFGDMGCYSFAGLFKILDLRLRWRSRRHEREV